MVHDRRKTCLEIRYTQQINHPITMATVIAADIATVTARAAVEALAAARSAALVRDLAPGVREAAVARRAAGTSARRHYCY
jgi:hypothetical protein